MGVPAPPPPLPKEASPPQPLPRHPSGAAGTARRTGPPDDIFSPIHSLGGAAYPPMSPLFASLPPSPAPWVGSAGGGMPGSTAAQKRVGAVEKSRLQAWRMAMGAAAGSGTGGTSVHKGRLEAWRRLASSQLQAEKSHSPPALPDEAMPPDQAVAKGAAQGKELQDVTDAEHVGSRPSETPEHVDALPLGARSVAGNDTMPDSSIPRSQEGWQASEQAVLSNYQNGSQADSADPWVPWWSASVLPVPPGSLVGSGEPLLPSAQGERDPPGAPDSGLGAWFVDVDMLNGNASGYPTSDGTARGDVHGRDSSWSAVHRFEALDTPLMAPSLSFGAQIRALGAAEQQYEGPRPLESYHHELPEGAHMFSQQQYSTFQPLGMYHQKLPETEQMFSHEQYSAPQPPGMYRQKLPEPAQMLSHELQRAPERSGLYRQNGPEPMQMSSQDQNSSSQPPGMYHQELPATLQVVPHARYGAPQPPGSYPQNLRKPVRLFSSGQYSGPQPPGTYPPQLASFPQRFSEPREADTPAMPATSGPYSAFGGDPAGSAWPQQDTRWQAQASSWPEEAMPPEEAPPACVTAESVGQGSAPADSAGPDSLNRLRDRPASLEGGYYPTRVSGGSWSFPGVRLAANLQSPVSGEGVEVSQGRRDVPRSTATMIDVTPYQMESSDVYARIKPSQSVAGRPWPQAGGPGGDPGSLGGAPKMGIRQDATAAVGVWGTESGAASLQGAASGNHGVWGLGHSVGATGSAGYGGGPLGHGVSAGWPGGSGIFGSGPWGTTRVGTGAWGAGHTGLCPIENAGFDDGQLTSGSLGTEPLGTEPLGTGPPLEAWGSAPVHQLMGGSTMGGGANAGAGFGTKDAWPLLGLGGSSWSGQPM
eukprot:jgi/Botrbrau1/6189/Bobra.0344s0029.1